MHESAMNYLKRIRSQYNFDGPVLEIGSININGSARDVFGDLQPYVGVDIVPGPNVDYVVDIRKHRHKDYAEDHPLNYPFRTIIATEVFEHVDPESILYAIHKMISNYDVVYVVITCAGPNRKPHSADGSPTLKPGEYYKNVDPEHLRSLLQDDLLDTHQCVSCIVEMSPDGTDVYATAVYV